jgi:hypothetical protein
MDKRDLGGNDTALSDMDRQPFIENIVYQFTIFGELESLEPFGTGHINSTFRSAWNQAGARLRYIHQRINEQVFVRPGEVMENIQRVTGHITRKLQSRGISGYSRRTLTVIPSRDGKPWVRDSEGGWWRTYLFIEGSRSLELTSTPDEARFLGKSVAHFQLQLADMAGERLYETIPGFHNMEKRYLRFYEALSLDCRDRAKTVQAEIDFMRENEERAKRFHSRTDLP